MRLQPLDLSDRKPARRWGPGEIVTLVVVACYGAAALIVAAGVFLRLAG